jgi:hypothetical protein
LEKSLVLTNSKMGYFAAHKYAKKRRMRMASHSLVDLGVQQGSLKKLVWARQWLIYPSSNKTFTPKRDIKDAQTGRGLPWEFVRNMDILRPNIALFVDPSSFGKYKKTGAAIIFPVSIAIIEDFPQAGECYTRGKADEQTAIPRIVTPKQWKSLHSWRKRSLYRFSEQSVVPISRGYDGFFTPEDKYVVNACFSTICTFYVALEG